MSTTYSNLVNVNGTIYNKQTMKGYATPAELAKDLGIAPHQIDWTKIAAGPLPTPQESQTFVYAGSNKQAVGPIVTGISPYDPTASFTTAPYSSGAVPDFIADQGKGQKYWKVAPAPAPAPAPTPTPTPTPSPVAPVKSLFKDSTAYKALPTDLKGLVDLAYSSFTGTPEEQQVFANALTQAQALADPYSKAQLALSLGEFQSKIAFSQGDLERASLAITTARDAIRESVGASKEFFSLEQQADLAREEIKYSGDLLDIADQAAEKGLTFATGARSRVLAEERRGAQFQDVVQSTRRRTNQQVKELELRAARGETDAVQQLADIKATSSFKLEEIGRSAEKVLGTARAAPLAGATGYAPVGGVLGDIEQQRRESIINAAKLGTT